MSRYDSLAIALYHRICAMDATFDGVLPHGVEVCAYCGVERRLVSGLYKKVSCHICGAHEWVEFYPDQIDPAAFGWQEDELAAESELDPYFKGEG